MTTNKLTKPLGNLDARRDWGHARDYVKGMWLMLQQPEPDDYVLATGRTVSVREFCRLAFSYLGLNYERHVILDSGFLRPAEVDVLQGDAGKAYRVLGWRPVTSLEEMVVEMIDADLKRYRARMR